MNQHVKQSLDYYCKNEVQRLKNSQRFSEICSLSKSNDYSVEVSLGEARDAKKNKYPKRIYLSFSVLDQQGETVCVDPLDYDHLSGATEILEIDRKNRVKFFSWQDDGDFIESLEWTIEELKKREK